MKSYRLDAHGLENLKIVDLALPEPGRGEVRVRVEAVALNYRDVMIVEGRYVDAISLPMVPVSDMAGTIDAVGDDVEGWRPGDRVMGQFLQNWIGGRIDEATRRSALGSPRPGMLAESVVLPASGIVRAPNGLSAEEASTLPIAALTAWTTLFEEGGLLPGQTVLTQGTGGVSLFAAQLAKAAGARVILTSSSDEKLARAKTEIGIDHGINYRTVPDWHLEALLWTGGQGVDVVVDLGGDSLARSLKAVCVGGFIGAAGLLGGTEAKISVVDAIVRSVTLRGISVGSRQAFERMNAAIAAYGLRPIVDRTFAFEDAREALSYLAGGGAFGKIVIRVAPKPVIRQLLAESAQ